MPPPTPDRDLLLGLLALQVDLITADQLDAALANPTPTRRPLGETLVAQGAISPGLHAALEPMLTAHIERHGGDPSLSLAALSSTDHLRAVLQRMGRAAPLLLSTATQAGKSPGETAIGQDRTIDFSAGRGPEASSGGEPSSRFRVLRPHARGGLGQVYVARDNELGRQVALKEILPDKSANPLLRSRFLLEAEINGNLEHPGIVPVYGLGTYADGRPFYAMRFIEGDSLKEAIERFHRRPGPTDASDGRSYDSLEFRQLLRRFIDVCNAIGYAHSRGVLHRDLKPANVMIGQYGETLLIDWGLAKATGRPDPATNHPKGAAFLPTSGSSIEQTEAGTTLGTPAFMSPEQASGQIDALGPATDLYSLGATLYTILTGRPPIDGVDDVAAVLARVRSGEIKPPRSLAPLVPRPLEAVCLKALALRPTERYPDARSLADDVERWLADEPVSADREPWIERSRRWARRNRTLVATATTAALVALAGLGTVAVVQTRARQQLSVKNDELTAANDARGRALDKANSRVELALRALGQFREAVGDNLDVQNRPENAPLRNDLLQAPIAFFNSLRDDLAEDPDARPEDRLRLADAQLELANLTRDIGNQAAALEAAGAAVATLETLAADRGEDSVATDARLVLLTALSLLFTLESGEGRGDQARQSLDRGIAIGQALIRDPDDLKAREGLANLLRLSASSHAKAGRSAAAWAELAKASDLLESAAPKGSDRYEATQILRFHVLAEMVELQSVEGKPTEAVAALQNAISLAKRFAEEENPSWEVRAILGDLLHDLGDNHLELDQPREALDDYRAAFAIYRTMLDQRPANLANRLDAVNALSMIARVEGELGRGEESLKPLAEANGFLEAARRDNPRNLRVLDAIVTLLQQRASLLFNLGHVDECLSSLESALPLQEELVQIEPQVISNHADLAGNLYNIAIMSKMLDRIDASLDADQQALAIRRKLADENPDRPNLRLQVAASLGNIASTYTGYRKDHETAVAYYRAANAILAKLVADHPEVAAYPEYLARGRSNIAATLDRLGRTETARAISAEAEAYLAQRVEAQPDLVQARSDLAGNQFNRADYAMTLRDYAEADRLNLAAIDTLMAIPESGRGLPDVFDTLAGAYKNLGVTAQLRGRQEEAIEHFDRAVAALLPDPANPPVDPQIRGRLGRIFYSRAESNARLGRRDAARDDWARSSAFHPTGEVDPASLGPILIRGWSGDAPGFLADAHAAIAEGSVPNDWLPDLARSACIGVLHPDLDAAAKAELSNAALEWLILARDRGAFSGAGSWTSLAGPAFDPIAERPEFRALIADLTFPPNPFPSEIAIH